jgi:hypothetical protein
MDPSPDEGRGLLRGVKTNHYRYTARLIQICYEKQNVHDRTLFVAAGLLEKKYYSNTTYLEFACEVFQSLENFQAERNDNFITLHQYPRPGKVEYATGAALNYRTLLRAQCIHE